MPMRDGDPLTEWLLQDEASELITRKGDRRVTETARALDELEARLAATDGGASAKKKRDLDVRGLSPGREGPVRLPDALRARAEALYERVTVDAGAGQQRAAEALLTLVGYTASSASVPFFRRLLAREVGVGAARDPFARRRCRLAIAGLALTAIKHRDRAALEALHETAADPDETLRCEAVLALGSTALDEGGTLDASTAAVIARVATSDPAFAPRFLARGYLLASGLELADFDESQVLAIEARLGEASRTVELRATDTIDDLAAAVVEAFGWELDHAYAFHMTNDEDDDRFELSPFADEDDEDQAAAAIAELFGEDPSLEGIASLLQGGAPPSDDEDAEGDPATRAEGAAFATSIEHLGVSPGPGPKNGESTRVAVAIEGAPAADEHEHEAGNDDDQDGEHDDDDDDESLEDIPLGALALPEGHAFLFRLDSDEAHRFALRVVATGRAADEGADYPRVIAESGEAPPQYEDASAPDPDAE